MTGEAMSWLVNKLGVDDVIDVVLYKKRIETSIDGIHCTARSVCSDNVVAYLFTKAFAGASASSEVKAAGYEMLKDAFRRGVLYHEDEGVFRRTRETFSGVSNTDYSDEHVRQARELLANELRRCVVCEIDVYTLFERFITCVEVDSRNYTYAIRRDRGVFHVIDEDPAVALHAINKLLMTHYRVVADPDLETFTTLTKIHAKTFC
jgi:hypothetical protein